VLLAGPSGTGKTLAAEMLAGELGTHLDMVFADALFGARTGAKDSRDRFVNIDTSSLLQRIEAFKGVALRVIDSTPR